MFCHTIQVMDFSAAQQAAHASEYADIMMATHSGLAPEAYKAQREHYLTEAKEAQRGCTVHFWRSATRLKRNAALIERERCDTFDRYLHHIVDKDTSQEEFTATIRSLLTDFPKVRGWLEWWLRPAIASMIFPSQSKLDPAVAEQVPSTSNPVEHQHALLHHATGKDHDFLPGIKKLYMHVGERESQYNAIRGEFPQRPSNFRGS